VNQRATSNAPADPISASRMDSVSHWRTSRHWPAPTAIRIATSRRRDTARAESRLATFAQAMRSTSSAAQLKTTSMGRLDSRTPGPSPRRTTVAFRPAFESG
jgi:hypothetical protein